MAAYKASAGHKHYLDWVRGYAMLLGVPFHVGLIYAVGNEWFVTSDEKSLLISWLTGLFTSFRMPLFFLISGLLGAMVLARRDPWLWLRKRFVRLGVPFVTAALTISPFVIWLIAFMQVGNDMALVTDAFMAKITTIGNHWVGHLWFLKVLLILSIATYALRGPIDTLRNWIRHSLVGDRPPPLYMVGLLTVGVVFYQLGVEATSFLAEGRLPVYATLNKILSIEATLQFAPYYFIGVLLYGMEAPRLHSSKVALAVIAAAAVIYMATWNYVAPIYKLLDYTSGAVLATLISLATLRWAEENIRTLGPFSRRLADGAFTIYLFHYPICVLFGYFLVQTGLPVLLQYGLNIAVTVAVSMAIHEVIRLSAITRFLYNGDALPTRRPSTRQQTPAE